MAAATDTLLWSRLNKTEASFPLAYSTGASFASFWSIAIDSEVGQGFPSGALSTISIPSVGDDE